MRRFLPLFACLACFAAPAVAQVTVDLRALDTLPSRPTEPSGHRNTEAGPRRVAPSAASEARPGHGRATGQIAPAAPSGTAPAEATAANASGGSAVTSTGAAAPAGSATAPGPATPSGATPPTAAGASPLAIPAAPPPVASVAPSEAPGGAAPAPENAAPAHAVGVRVTFAAGDAALSQADTATLHDLVQATPTTDTTTFNVLAYAAGVPDDPSAARRIALSRAVAVRNALMADGVPSSRIILRALGAQSDAGPPDRVDLAVLGANGPGAAGR